MKLIQRINDSHVLRTYLHMIKTAPLDVVQQLKQNLEIETNYKTHKHYETLNNEFKNRLNEQA